MKIVIGAALMLSLAWGQATPAIREIVKIRGDLYRARNNFEYNIFLVTPEGIVLVDPGDSPRAPEDSTLASWLKEQLAQRFGVPVKYVIYSHGHWDHIENGGVFADTAQFVAHENLAKQMDGRFPLLPGGIWDDNGNGKIDYGEHHHETGLDRPGMLDGTFHRLDRNHDDAVTPAEMFADVVPPTILYSDRMTLKLGGETVELIHPGRNHTDDSTIVYFPAERVVYASDFLGDAGIAKTNTYWPIGWGDFDWAPLADWIHSIQVLEGLDFDVFAPSHGDLWTRADVVANREWFEEIVAAVSAAMRQGMPLEDMKKTILMPKYRDWEGYEKVREFDIEAVYNNLRKYR